MRNPTTMFRAAALAGTLLLVSTAMADELVPTSAEDAKTTIFRAIGLGASAAFAIAFSVMGAAYAVARIGSAALGAAVEKPELLVRSLLFVALAEGLAVLGFAIAMMLIQKI